MFFYVDLRLELWYVTARIHTNEKGVLKKNNAEREKNHKSNSKNRMEKLSPINFKHDSTQHQDKFAFWKTA